MWKGQQIQTNNCFRHQKDGQAITNRKINNRCAIMLFLIYLKKHANPRASLKLGKYP